MMNANHGRKNERKSADIGSEMYELARQLFPINRSITGEGVRETLRLIGKDLPMEIHSVPTGTKIFDWEIPPEWDIRDGYIADRSGRRIVDFKENNLHVVGYSHPVRAQMSLEELRPHLHTLESKPDCIPYRTSYYAEDWGFCVTRTQLESMPDRLEVCIDSSLVPGVLNYGEVEILGTRREEFIFYTHTCHPSLANDNVSGMVLCTYLAKHLLGQKLKYTYRFLFGPGTLGSLTWLSRNRNKWENIRYGLVAVLVGDRGHMVYKKTRSGNTELDTAVAHVLANRGKPYRVIEFLPWGYDERQFCSPGINLPVGRLTRTPHDEYPEYHTSADNLGLLRPDCLADSLEAYLGVIGLIESNKRYLNLNPFGEPKLSRYGLYSKSGGLKATPQTQLAIMWVLNLSDGVHDLLDIAQPAAMPFADIASAARVLESAGLLRAIDGGAI